MGEGLDSAATDVPAHVWGAAGSPRVSLGLGEGPWPPGLALLAILVVAGAVTPLYPQVTHDDRGGGPKKVQPLPSSRAVVMSMSLQTKFRFPQWTSHLCGEVLSLFLMTVY